MADFAKESGHWYLPDGTPRYTIIGKNGNERAVTLRDARTERLFPSVTSIIRCAAAPGLERWKSQQLLMAALTLPKIAGETENAWLERVQRDSQEEGRKAAEEGTRIHGLIERFYSGLDTPLLDIVHVQGVVNAVQNFAPDVAYSAEKSFASPIGYGGKVDLHGDGFVIDFKGKEFSAGDKVETYPEHAMQLAAYRKGLGMPEARCAICYFSRSVPGLARLIEIPEPELVKGFGMFKGLLDYWMASKEYNPCA